ncbi:hypothetical protein [Corynebacterium glyciniphilum]|uniref:hypothetical protein n=1 Tax=Corynebacterium glyciniphilum TaxID=1404244 RepID=UPI003FD6787F
MTLDLDKLKSLATPQRKEWEPGMRWDGETGYVTTAPISSEEGAPTSEVWNHVLDEFGLDPARYVIDGPVRQSAWTVPGHGLQRSYRARIVERPERRFDIEDLLDTIWADGEYPDNPGAEWRTIQIGDTHLAKGSLDGGGTDKLIARWQSSVTEALNLGGHYEGVHLAFLGDLIEGEVSQGGANIAGNDLTLTESLRVARHLVSWTVQEALKVGNEVIVSAVGGNHGQTTRVQNRPHTDNHDIDVVSAVQQAFELSGLDERITWYYPEDGTNHVVYEVGGTVFASTHGHTFKGGPVAGAAKWWSGMCASNRPAAAAQVLMAGHFHQPVIQNFTSDKWICFGGALETQSTWIHEQNGTTSKQGMLTYVTRDGEPFEFSIV